MDNLSKLGYWLIFNVFFRGKAKKGTICDELKKLWKHSRKEYDRIVLTDCLIMAKKMDKKLKWYKEKTI